MAGYDFATSPIGGDSKKKRDTAPLSEVRGATNKADDWVQGKLKGEGSQTPVLATNAGEVWNSAAGTGKLLGGVFSGNKREIKAGLSQSGKSIISALTSGTLRSLNQAPPQQYLGGSRDALANMRDRYQAGQASGQGYLDAGVNAAAGGYDTLNAAAAQGQQDRSMAQGLYGEGAAVGLSGIGNQNAAVANARSLAAQPTDSLALAQLQQAQDRQANEMQAQAATARGGNQAAAMALAQNQASQNGLVTQQQAAQLRAGEEQAALGRRLGVEELASGVGGQQAGLGLGLQGQGTGYALQGTGQLADVGARQGSIGLGIGGLGVNQQQIYANAENEANKNQLDADQKHASASQSAKGGIMGAAKSVISKFF